MRFWLVIVGGLMIAACSTTEQIMASVPLANEKIQSTPADMIYCIRIQVVSHGGRLEARLAADGSRATVAYGLPDRMGGIYPWWDATLTAIDDKTTKFVMHAAKTIWGNPIEPADRGLAAFRYCADHNPYKK